MSFFKFENFKENLRQYLKIQTELLQIEAEEKIKLEIQERFDSVKDEIQERMTMAILLITEMVIYIVLLSVNVLLLCFGSAYLLSDPSRSYGFFALAGLLTITLLFIRFIRRFTPIAIKNRVKAQIREVIHSIIFKEVPRNYE
ncbi:MAG: hypothetical protein AAFU64_07570 [Bacteroidota bacterium]